MNITKKTSVVLLSMLKELEKAPIIYKPSKYWQDINFTHIEDIHVNGIKYFKRTINREYFNWMLSGFFMQQLTTIFSEILRGNLNPIFKSKIVDNVKGQYYRSLKRTDNIVYKVAFRICIAYLFDYVSRIDRLGILQKVSEPLEGSPLLIRYRGKLISQDLANSVHEFYSITEKIDFKRNIEVGELGAGYGRVAYVFLKTIKQSRYTIIDIPPALFISQEYLRKVFPRENFFFFRPFKKFSDVEKEFKSARIRFLLPHQIEQLPKDIFDIFINISSLHEMRRNQIKNYFAQIDRLTNGYVYLKEWKKAKAKDNNYIEEGQYPIPKTWEKVYQRSHPVQNMFFEGLYQLKRKTRA